ncbi:MAG: family 10 glycosylhydrolase [Clostridia bacterium]|nr:family 10 glycosylhydrolase [Clostridia bacterium]
MKKIVAIILMLVISLTACGNIDNSKEEITGKYENSVTGGVWLSFSEINSILKSDDIEEQIEQVASNCKDLDIKDIYIHTVSYCDAIYKSKIYPQTANSKVVEFDVLEKFIDIFHKNEIRVHAWINLYRVSTTHSEPDKLDEKSIVRKWLSDEDKGNDSNVSLYNGIYLNPSSEQVRQFITSAITEICESYEVDGIHFDDYFYPTTDIEFDKTSYEEYISGAESPLSLADWRRANVNILISDCYDTIKEIDENIEFSISPTADIKKNYNELYADVEYWIESGYVDSIIPQLYFGFSYPDKAYRFENLLEEWTDLSKKNSQVDLLIGLATYKIGTTAVPDNEEWQKYEDIIARQAEICYNNSFVKGFVLFSYSSAFSSELLNVSQTENLKVKLSSFKGAE